MANSLGFAEEVTKSQKVKISRGRWPRNAGLRAGFRGMTIEPRFSGFAFEAVQDACAAIT